jgi:hypothetical protein
MLFLHRELKGETIILTKIHSTFVVGRRCRCHNAISRNILLELVSLLPPLTTFPILFPTFGRGKLNGMECDGTSIAVAGVHGAAADGISAISTGRDGMYVAVLAGVHGAAADGISAISTGRDGMYVAVLAGVRGAAANGIPAISTARDGGKILALPVAGGTGSPPSGRSTSPVTDIGPMNASNLSSRGESTLLQFPPPPVAIEYSKIAAAFFLVLDFQSFQTYEKNIVCNNDMA